MKPAPSPTFTRLALAVASIAGFNFTLHAATEATTDPVGFITVKVKGGGTTTTPALSLISPTLFRPVEWQGPIASFTAGTTINVSASPWTAGAYAEVGGKPRYFVEITTGTKAGAWSDIVSNTASALVTADALSTFATGSDTIRIRKHCTLADFLGTQNSAGLKSGVQVADADEVYIYDGGNGGAPYWYYNGQQGGSAGWVDSNFDPVDATQVAIAPNQGVVILHKASTALNFVTAGTVKTGNTYVVVSPGLNVVGTVAAQGLTLGTSGLFTGNANTGVKGGTELARADKVTVYDAATPTGQETYWYYDGSQGGQAGWYDTDFETLRNSAPINPGSSIVITRAANLPQFNWTVPSPSTF
jgi:uncharacterized protein (TIGR02597 family)